MPRSRPDLHTSWDESAILQFDQLMYNLSTSQSIRKDTELHTFLSQEGR